MEDIERIGLLINEIGIPALFFIIVAILIFKVFPNYMEERRKQKDDERKERAKQDEATQKYYNERNESYKSQMDVMNNMSQQTNQMIGQATQVIAQSNEVIKLNMEVIRQNTNTHKTVKDALGRDLEVLKSLSEDLKDHSKIATEIKYGVEKLIDRSEA